MTDRTHELNGFTEAINDGPMTASEIFDMIQVHYHRCQNCGNLLEHDSNEPCNDFIAGITKSCKAMDTW